VLSHANLLANIRALGQAMEASSADIFVSWLPLYHDMGLIGAWLGCLYFAAPLYVMSPLSFLTRPESWLWAIHRFRATLSGAPNFAYELCLNKIDDRNLECGTMTAGSCLCGTVRYALHGPLIQPDYCHCSGLAVHAIANHSFAAALASTLSWVKALGGTGQRRK